MLFFQRTVQEGFTSSEWMKGMERSVSWSNGLGRSSAYRTGNMPINLPMFLEISISWRDRFSQSR